MSLPKDTRRVINLVGAYVKGAYRTKFATDKSFVYEDAKDYSSAKDSFNPYVQKDEDLSKLTKRYVGVTVREAPPFVEDSSVTTPGIEQLLAHNNVTTVLTVSMVGGYSELLDCNIMAFRGTTDKSEFEASIEAKDILDFFGNWGFGNLESLKAYGINIDGKCKKSVLEWLNKSTPQARSLLKQFLEAIENADPTKPFEISGHSLGGAAATIFAILAALSKKFPRVRLTLYGTFSILDEAAVAEFNKLGIECNNFQYIGDLVPQLNNPASTIGPYVPGWNSVKAWMEKNVVRLTKHVGTIWIGESPGKGNPHRLDNYMLGTHPSFNVFKQQKDFTPSTNKTAIGPDLSADVKAGIAQDIEEQTKLKKAAPTTNGVKK